MIELDSLEAFDAHVRAGLPLDRIVLLGLDLTGRTAALLSCSARESVFIGCRLAPEALRALADADALVLPALPDLPFRPYRTTLYSVEELYDGFDPQRPLSYVGTLDAAVLEHWRSRGRAADASILETLCQRMHDHGITTALRTALLGRAVVGIAGGCEIRRDHADYRRTAELAWNLTRRGYLCVSGGGPGTMEAVHLGAYMSQRSIQDLGQAVVMLAEVPRHDHPMWLTAAYRVRRRFPLADPESGLSIGIPTWLHPHEAPNPFATHIAKYFTSSVREDGLGSIATEAVIFVPGGASTVLEISREATALHDGLRSSGAPRPLIFFGEHHWTTRLPLFPMIAQLAAGRPYAQHLYLTDEPREVLERVAGNPLDAD